jgi:hypothetical protein
MITLEFQIDEGVLAEDAAEDPATADASALEQTFFVMPVRFAVNGTELFGIRELEHWQELPLLGFATALRRVIVELRKNSHARTFLAGGGELRCQRTDDAVQLVNSLNKRVATADAEALRAAVQDFARRARLFLETRFPPIQTHPHWRSWWEAI